MRPLSVFAAAAVFLACCGLLSESFKVAAFNIKCFGVAKYNKTNVKNILVKIVRRYDLVFIQEIRDKNKKMIFKFLDDVNNGSEYVYWIAVSESLPRQPEALPNQHKYMEQYAYIYRTATVTILHGPFVSKQDFERPPYCVQVEPTDSRLPTFIAIGVHVKPKPGVTKAEIDRLPAVYEEAVAYFDLQTHDEVDHAEQLAHEAALQDGQVQAIANYRDEPGPINLGDELLDDLDQNQNPVNVPALLMGDFNADGRYLSKDEYKNLKLITDGRFKSLIDEKTNVKNTFSYDRFFTAGGLDGYVKNNKATVFRFDEAYNLSPAQTKNVSDHYPIELELLQPLPTEKTETSEEKDDHEEEEREKEETLRKKEKERKKEKRKEKERKKEEKENDDEERRRKEEKRIGLNKKRSTVNR